MKIWLLVWISSHLLFWVFWPLAVAVLAVGIVLAVRRSPRQILPMAAGCPFVLVPALFFGGGILSFVTGSAVLMTYGMPEPEFDNLDSELRCHRSTSGCVVDGSEAFRHAPNNAAVRMMIRSFGPMSGAYRGAYPSKAEVQALLAREPRRFTTSELGAALLAAGLPDEVGRGAFCTKGMPPELTWAVIDVQGEALLVAYPEEATLLDKSTGRVFARYRF